MNGLLHVQAASPLGKEPRYSLNRRLSRPQRWFERFGEEKKLVPIGNITPERPAPTLVTIPTTL